MIRRERHASNPVQETRFQEVTDCPNRLAAAQRIVAESYCDFTDGSETLAGIRRRLADDGDQRLTFKRTFSLYGTNPNTHRVEILGTIRTCTLKFGCELQGLESFELMHFPGGWSRFDFAGFNPSHVIEFGRLAVSKSIRVGVAHRLKFHQAVVQALFKRAYLCTLAMGSCSEGWAIIPAKIRHILGKCDDIECEVAPGAEPHETRHHELFEQFSGYWYAQNPRLCNLQFTRLTNDPLAGFWQQQEPTGLGFARVDCAEMPFPTLPV
ncbi:MAG: hypothetical protein KDB22_06610 [Planctomycetales bacterium]|nr:hypothetical protein [Planctomycetales bacterium]